MQFQYWEHQLVELHELPLRVDRENDYQTAQDWHFPGDKDSVYPINVFIGFDPERSLQDKMAPCSLLIFSRISGRLFLQEDDARGSLYLTNSGTDFCQGLTVIVDDYEGNLPLTPTKEVSQILNAGEGPQVHQIHFHFRFTHHHHDPCSLFLRFLLTGSGFWTR